MIREYEHRKREDSYIQGEAAPTAKRQVGQEKPAGAEQESEERIGEEDKAG